MSLISEQQSNRRFLEITTVFCIVVFLLGAPILHIVVFLLGAPTLYIYCSFHAYKILPT